MHRRPIRFTSQWALVGVILFYAVGTATITWHMGTIVTPTSAMGSSECVAMPEVSNLPELLVGDYRSNSATGLIQSDELGSNLKLSGDTFGTERSSNGSITTTEVSPGQNIEKTSTTTIETLTRIRTKAKCVETILRKAVIEPYHINGQIQGLRLTGLDKILLAKDLLIQSGDIIRAVNGQPLNSKRRAYEIFKKARKLPTMKIELLRDGKTRTFLYYLR